MNLKFELFKNLQRTAKLQLTTLAVISCCMFVLLTLVTLQSNLDEIFSAWTKNLKITAYLNDNIAKDEIDKIILQIKKNDKIKELNYISKDQYKEEFDRKLTKVMPKLAALKNITNPFKDGLEISVVHHSNMASIGSFVEGIANHIATIGGINEVSFGKIWLKEYSALSYYVSYAAVVIIFALLLSISFIIGNAVRTLIDYHKKEVHILSILGATNKAIYAPFYVNVALLLLSGFIIAVLLTMIVFSLTSGVFSNYIDSLNLQLVFPSLSTMLVMFICISLFAFIGSHLHLIKLSKSRYNYDI